MRNKFPILLIAAACLFGVRPAAAQDAAAGQEVFHHQCATCHSAAADRNVIGPSLFGVVGRKAGIVPGFHYSAANKASGEVWDAATLDKYLTSPKQVVPGTTMTFAGVKDAKMRTDLIAYLATLH